MKLRQVGSTDIWVSPLGLGTVKFGRNQGVKYPKPFEIPDDKHLLNVLATAREHGINLLDTAPAYGNSETRLGELLRQSFKNNLSNIDFGNRHDWVLMSKVGEEFEHGESFYNFTPEHADMSLKRSLSRLQTDYLDIVLVHSDGEDLKIIHHYGLLDYLAYAKSQGLIRAFGMSTKTVEGGMATVDKADAVMLAYNPHQRDEKPVINYAHKKYKGVFIKKALASGHLNKLTSHLVQGESNDPIKTAFDFIFEEPGVSSIIIGTVNTEHLIHNIKALSS
jgi:aryl-alcohol dehydrogenase-like predicted oxidoreductase